MVPNTNISKKCLHLSICNVFETSRNGVCLVGQSFPHPAVVFRTNLEPPSGHISKIIFRGNFNNRGGGHQIRMMWWLAWQLQAQIHRTSQKIWALQLMTTKQARRSDCPFVAYSKLWKNKFQFDKIWMNSIPNYQTHVPDTTKNMALDNIAQGFQIT